MNDAERIVEELESLLHHGGWKRLLEQLKKVQQDELIISLESKTIEELAEHRGHVNGIAMVIEEPRRMLERAQAKVLRKVS